MPGRESQADVSKLGLQTRSLGIRLPDRRGSVAATVISSVGCPMGCNFCTTSTFFGGKGNLYNFYETGDELFELMDRFEKSMKVQREFPVASRTGDGAAGTNENGGQELGVSWIWMGLESQSSGYAKSKWTDTHELTSELRKHEVRVQSSTIIGLEHHTPENIEDEIERAVSHETDFHEFMLYTPVPGTPLHFEMKKQGRLLNGVDLADIYGQFPFNFKHTAISPLDSQRFLDWAFLRDFQRNGPSLYRMCRTMLEGWKRYRDYSDARVRRAGSTSAYAGA